MNDLEYDLRTLLDEKSQEAGVVPGAPPRTLRRARRRQIGTVLATALTVAGVVAGSIVGMQALLDRPSGTTVANVPDLPPALEGYRSVALPFASIAYPKGWYLVDLGGSHGPRLQLSNFDARFTEPCFSGDAAPLPPDGVVLLVEAGSGFTGEGSPRWPADLTYDPSPSACRTGSLLESPEPGLALHYSATWTSADGATPYTANAMIGPEASQADRDALDLAFGSLTVVEGGAPQTEALLDTPALVLDAADTPLGPVVLYAYDTGDDPDGGLWIGVAGPAGSHLAGSAGGGGDRPPMEDEDVTMIIGERSLVWGDVSAEAARAEFRTAEGGTYPATLVPLPPSLGAESIQAVWGVVDAPTEKRITTVLFDENGVMLNAIVPTARKEVVATGEDPEGGAWTVSITHDTMGDGIDFSWETGSGGGSCCLSRIPEGRDLWLDQNGTGSGQPQDVLGFATPAVARVDIVTADGVFPSELFPFPEGYIGQVQLWVAIVPHAVDLDGHIVAYDSAGAELDREIIGATSEPTGATAEIDAVWQDLRHARDAISTYAARNPLGGLTDAVLAGLGADVTWNRSTTAVPGEVSVRDAVGAIDPATGDLAGGHVVLVGTTTFGQAFCIAVTVDARGGDSYRYGQSDPQSADECRGGWDVASNTTTTNH